MGQSIKRINEYNKAPISLREGKVFIDGTEIMDCVKCTVKYTPELWEGRQLGEHGKSRRQLSYDVTGTITERRSTAWLFDIIKKYQKVKRTPEFTIQGIMDDENSDYHEGSGNIVVTCVGCVLNGDIQLINLDSGGQVFEEEISFAAYDIIL